MNIILKGITNHKEWSSMYKCSDEIQTITRCIKESIKTNDNNAMLGDFIALQSVVDVDSESAYSLTRFLAKNYKKTDGWKLLNLLVKFLAKKARKQDFCDKEIK